MSVEEWLGLPEDEPGELVDGVLVEEEMPDLMHESVVSWLIGVLRAWIVARRGFVFGSEAKYVLPRGRGRKPDVTVFFAGRRLPRRGGVRIAPDIAVEVISPSPEDERRDRIDKPDDYAVFGIRYLWLVDPLHRTVEMFELGPDGRYIRALGASEGMLTEVPGCEGLSLDLDALWAEVDRLDAENDTD